ncbi:MAG: hypothetical protein HRU23_11545 [Gammaproteobacteria bacterium]|nr:hypothetical protein [Gammaproteobacteria bacterium]
MPKLDFSALNKQAANSFQQQRNLIKKVCRGDKVLCQHCQQPLALIPAENKVASIRCTKGCTTIELELD